MDRELLFQYMRVKFREAGFTPQETELHVQSFTERYQGKTDEEVEADLMRRGGPSRVVAAVIEKRNSVLMEDEDYRAFVEARLDKTVEDVPAAEAVPEEDDDIRIHTPKAQPQEEPVSLDAAETVVEEDPLAVWFSDDGKQEEALPPLFRASDDSGDKAASMPAAEPEQPQTDAAQTQTVHTIPLFAGEAQAAQQPAAAPRTAPAQPQPRSTAQASGEPDMSRTRVMPTAEQTVVPPPVPRPAPQPQRMPGGQEQLWGSAHITDETPQRHAPRPAPQTRPQPAHRQQQSSARPAKEPRYEYSDRGNVTRLQEMTYWGEGSEEGVRRFRILFAVSLPFVIALLLVYLVLAVGIVLGIVALMIGLVIALVVEVAVGSLIALIGIIYGISQVFLVLPIGMFELGLGIAVVGITMLAGIVIYNLAVR
ncbi:MAG: DUF308 domain-containing protein, partial [Clostridia bacterium]|nr:DUF308 domain-containing protein [Clostridia bacterium]